MKSRDEKSLAYYLVLFFAPLSSYFITYHDLYISSPFNNPCISPTLTHASPGFSFVLAAISHCLHNLFATLLLYIIYVAFLISQHFCLFNFFSFFTFFCNFCLLCTSFIISTLRNYKFYSLCYF